MRTIAYGCALVCLLAGCLLVSACATAAEWKSAASPVLWGSLKGGPHSVGFKRNFVIDRSRTWKLAREQGPLGKPLEGRPIQFNIWYPAKDGELSGLMKLADYYPSSAPPGFELLNQLMRARADWDGMDDRLKPRVGTAMAARMAAVLDAPPAKGRFPVVLMFGGSGDDINANAVLAEYLASRGFVVVSVSLLGRSDEETGPSGGSDGIETTSRDMEYVLAIVDRYAYVDASRIAAVGHSIGAVDALLLAMHNGAVSAVVGLDSTYGFKGLDGTATGAVGYSVDQFRAGVLDIRRAEGEGGAVLDTTVLDALRYSERWRVTLPAMQHNDFTSRAETGALAFHGKDVPRVVQSGKAGYETVCVLLGRFLASRFDAHGAVSVDMEGEARSAGAGFRHWVAENPPETAWQQWAATISKGLEAIQERLRKQCGGEPMETCSAVEALQSAGDEFGARGQRRDALIVSQVVAAAHPRSVFAQDGLADAYRAAGDLISYRKALERAIDLMPMDPRLLPESRESFELMERDKLDRLPR